MAINSSKVDEEQKEVLKSATIRRLFSYLKNYKRQVAVVLVVLAVTIAISTVNPLLLEYAIDVNIAQKDWARACCPLRIHGCDQPGLRGRCPPADASDGAHYQQHSSGNP